MKGLYDTVRLRIPKGTSSHEQFRLSGKGVKKGRMGDSFGDHFVNVKVAVPNNPNDIQRALMVVFAETDPNESKSGGINLSGVPIQLVDAIKTGLAPESPKITEAPKSEIETRTQNASKSEPEANKENELTDEQPQASKA